MYLCIYIHIKYFIKKCAYLMSEKKIFKNEIFYHYSFLLQHFFSYNIIKSKTHDLKVCTSIRF